MTAVLTTPVVNFAQHDLQIGERVRVLPISLDGLPPVVAVHAWLTTGHSGEVVDVCHDGIAWIISVLLDGQEWALPYTLADLVRER